MKSIETYYLNKIVKVLQEGYSHALLKEAVPYSIVKDYLKIKRSPEVESLLLSVFSKLKSLPNATQLDKKGYRISFPFNMKGGEVKDKSPIESEIDSLIQKHGFKVKDYFKGLAFDEKNKRDIKIGKVLNIVSKKDKKAEQLLNKFNTDTKRTQTKSSDEKLVVFSYHPYDIAGMSAGRDWTSCMDVIKGGSNTHYVYVDIEKGTCIAYVINKEDINIKKPLARILIKPYLNVEDQKDTLLYPEEQVYGQIPNEGKFVSFVDDTMEKVQKMSGTYKRLGCLYDDSDRDTIQDKETTLKIAKEKIESNERLNDREYKVLPNDLKQLYIEKRVEDGRELSDPQYEDASDNLKQLYIEKRVEAGYGLSNPQYEDAPDNLKQLYIENLVEAGLYLYNPQYEVSPDSIKQFYIEKIVEESLELPYSQYKASSDNIKQLYIEIIIAVGDGLSNSQYEASPDSVKQFYIEKIVEAGLYLSDPEYKDAPDNLKQLYIEKRVEAGYQLSYSQYKATPDNLKQLYIEKLVEAGLYLSNPQYEASPNNLKQLYIEKIVEAGLRLSDPQYEDAPDNLKQLYIKKRVKAGGYLSDPQYKDAPDNLKQLYIKKLVEQRSFLSNPQYEASPDSIKQFYIKKIVEAGLYLFSSQYEASPDSIKKYYFKLVKDNNFDVSYFDYYNDYQEYLKNNP